MGPVTKSRGAYLEVPGFSVKKLKVISFDRDSDCESIMHQINNNAMIEKLLEEVTHSIQTLNLSNDDCVEQIIVSLGKLTINQLNTVEPRNLSCVEPHDLIHGETSTSVYDHSGNIDSIKDRLRKNGCPEHLLSKSKNELIIMLLEIIIDNYVTITTLKDYLKSIGRNHMGIKSIIINRILSVGETQ